MTGVVEERRVAPGSKSDMIVTVLVPDDSSEDVVVLRRRSTATVLSADPAFAAHVGKRVTVSGRRSFTSFVVERIEPA